MLAALCLAVYLPGLSALSPVDRDEPRFAQASRQMAEAIALPPEQQDPGLHAGGWAMPMVGDRPRLNKPPLIYWAQSAGVLVLTGGDPLRDALWMYRVPSVLFATGAVLLTYALGRRAVGPAAALGGAAFLALSPMVVWDAHVARSDQALLFFTTLALLPAWRVIECVRRGRRPGWGTVLWLWASVGLGVLAKGPITPMVVVLGLAAIAALARDRRYLTHARPLAGLAVVTLLVLPWVLAVGARVGFGSLAQIAFDETIGRGASPRESHFGPPGYHLVLLAVLLWPGSLTALSALRGAARSMFRDRLPAGHGRAWLPRAAHPGNAAALLCLIAPSWLVFEAALTKLPHYTLPLYPLVALLCAKRLLVIARHGRFKLGAGGFIWAVIGVALAASPVAAYWFFTADPPPRWLALVCAAAAVGVIAGDALLRARPVAAVSVAAAAWAFVIAGPLYQYALPRLGEPSREAARELLQRAGAPGPTGAPPRPVAAIGYHEDSLVFLTRGRIERLGLRTAQDSWIAANPGGLLVFRYDSPLIRDRRVRAVTSVEGLNISTGRRERLVIAEVVRPLPPASRVPAPGKGGP